MPEATNRNRSYDSITVIICLLTSMVQLVPSQTNYNSQQLGELMFEEVYKYHRLPENIISDWDVLFTSTFWKRLHQLIGTSLWLSSAYHPQTNGATQCANQTITQMLCQCIQPNQQDWVSKLPTIQLQLIRHNWQAPARPHSFWIMAEPCNHLVGTPLQPPSLQESGTCSCRRS